MSTAPALSTEGLGKQYGAHWALHDCTLEVPAGHLAALVETPQRLAAMAALAFAGLVPSAMQASTPSAPLVIEGLGKGTAVLNGPWQFHPGDDPAWANPAFDSSDWEHLAADRPWGSRRIESRR